MTCFNFTDIDKLISFLQIDQKNEKQILKTSSFKLNLPARLAEKIKKNDPSDPIFKQFVPTKEETKKSEGFSTDPLCEQDFQENNFLIQKYHNRALLITSQSCAMNCRFCFRRYFPYKQTSLKEKITAIDKHIAKNKNLNEIILSGGDPLSLNNKELKEIFSHLNAISHLTRIRLHTRFLTAFPERIDEELLRILSDTDKQIIFVIHANHPSELDEEIFASIKKLQKLTIPVFSQTILLKGINDNPSTLNDLYNLLTNKGVIPYYLHQLDKVAGARHFEVPVAKGKTIVKKLRQINSGYAVPAYVKEEPHKTSKTLIL